MQNTTFTDEGFIFPNEKINVDLVTLKTIFVDSFPNSTTRKTLYDNYLRYIDDFSKQITPNFTQWINGSFVTLKENPNDIDFVTFIDVDIYERNEPNIGNFMSFSLEKEGLDAYILQIYPQNHILYEAYSVHNQKKWFERFSNTRKDKQAKSFKKGFFEINI